MKEKEAKMSSTLSLAFRRIIWPRRKIVFAGLILIAIGRLAGIVLPWKTRVLLDDVIPRKDYHAMYTILLVVLLSIVVQAAASFFVARLLSIQAEFLIRELRIQVQRKVISLPIRFFDNAKSGALVSRIMTDVEGIRNLVGEGLVQMVGGLFTALICLVFLIKINALMTAIVLIPVAVFGVAALKSFQYMHPVFVRQREINAEVTGRLSETLAGVRVIKGFNAEARENKVFEAGVDHLHQNVKKSLMAEAIIMSSSTFLLGIASAGVIGIGSYNVMRGTMTVGDFLSFAILLAFMIVPIIQVSNIGSQLTQAFAGLDRTEELMNMEPEENLGDRTVQLDKIKGDIVFKDVSFAYEAGKEVLHTVSFKAQSGKVTALVGGSGSGKSTIAGLAASFLNPRSGTVTIDGQDISRVNLSSYRKNLGVVLQDEFLFEGTIRENIFLSKPEATEEELQRAVKVANVNEFTDRFEKGLDTRIGERGVKLSGGQRQRIAIARVILADSRIVILDEATSSLDTESEALIQDSLAALVEGRTTIVIAHRLSTIKRADQILVVESGSILETGTHEELLKKEGRYFQLYNYQARI